MPQTLRVHFEYASRTPVASTSRCPVFIARDLSGFAFCLPLTEGARRATKVSGKQKVKPDGGPTLGVSSHLKCNPRLHQLSVSLIGRSRFGKAFPLIFG